MLQKLFKPSPYNKTNLPAYLQVIPEQDACVFVIWATTESLKQPDYLPALKDLLFQSIDTGACSGAAFWLRDGKISNFSLKDRESGGKGKVIVAMLRIGNIEKVKALALLSAIEARGYQVKALVVKNSVPLNGEQSAEQNSGLGICSSGLASVSFFKAEKGLSKEQFWDYWFNSHTPFALDIHPLCKYERNRVLSSLDEKPPVFDAPVFDAIVPLHIQKDDYLSFSVFFSHDGRSAFANALRIYNDVKQFIDMSGIETVAMREYVLSK